jgi:polar amino acid transport system permease protein
MIRMGGSIVRHLNNRTNSACDGTLDADDASLAVARRHRLYWIFLLVLVTIGVQLTVLLVRNPRFGWPIVGQYFFAPAIRHGLEITIELTFICGIIGIFLGTFIALARLSNFFVLRNVAVGYVWLFRAVPTLVQLLFWFNLAYLVPSLGLGVPFGPVFGHWSANSLIKPLTAAIIGLSLHEAACDAEIVRAGILSVDTGQVDAAKALGLRPVTVFRRVVLPQAARVIIPPLGTQMITLLKGTSLVSVIALSDLLFSVENIYGVNLEVVPLLLVASIWYVILVAILSIAQSRIERKLSQGYDTASRRTGSSATLVTMPTQVT